MTDRSATRSTTQAAPSRRILVTGATGFLGYRVVRALLDENVAVTALAQPDSIEKLSQLRGNLYVSACDIWNPASLRGRARGHQVVIHLVGGIKPDLARGLTFRHLNTVSARNVIQMAVSDGVPHFIFLSVAAKPLGAPAGYVESKRDAESYLQKTGLTWTILRAPPLYIPGQRRNPFYAFVSALRVIPIVSSLLSPYIPLAVDTAARGIASLAMSADHTNNRLITPVQLRRLGREAERTLAQYPAEGPSVISDKRESDDPPFGWLPLEKTDRFK